MRPTYDPPRRALRGRGGFLSACGWLGVLTSVVLGGSAPARATEDAVAPGQDTFGLGQIIVYGKRPDEVVIGSDTLSSAALFKFNRPNLDDAVALLPGVGASNSGGQRNERLIFVRGFDRFQVPLSIDGIRVYLPADNRLDFGRFLTPDVAEIQVAKGYVSVLNGPGNMGGAINLVTRKPTKNIDVEGAATITLDNKADYAASTIFGLVGTKQDLWYAQISGTWQERDHFRLPSSFTPTVNENGGKREKSDTEDWRINVKIGYTPSAGNEYSINYTRQEGSKNSPAHITNPINTQRAWKWPYWNIDSLYFLSTSELSDSLDLKLRAYYNTFKNLLQSFDDQTQTAQTQGYTFDSYYDDKAYGGSAELAVKLNASNTTRLAAHYRRDRHVEYQTLFTPVVFTEPEQISVEDTYSLALEHTLDLSSDLRAVAGFSYDHRDLRRAEDFTGGNYVIYPLADDSSWNAQAALKYQLGVESEVHVSVSSRTRFPSLFERFSSRFGGATSNAGLAAERATSIEIGGSGVIGAMFVEGALFYNDVSNLIVAIPIIYMGNAVNQNQNVGSAKFYGAEMALSAAVSDNLTVGGNYTFTQRRVDNPSDPALRLTGVPKHKGFAYMQWSPFSRLQVIPSVDVASDRWTVTTNGATYYKTGAFALVNLRLDFELTDYAELGIGARNLLDENYLLTDGFPEQGRTFFMSLRVRH